MLLTTKNKNKIRTIQTFEYVNFECSKQINKIEFSSLVAVKKTSKALHRNKHIVSISEARIFKTLSITEAERKKADAYKKKGVVNNEDPMEIIILRNFETTIFLL